MDNIPVNLKAVKRHKGKFFLFLLLILIVLYYSSGYFFVYNNDAYVNASVVEITSVLPGKVKQVYVEDNMHVQRGDKLFSLDKSSFELDVKQAEAALERKRTQLALMKTVIDSLGDELDSKKTVFHNARIQLEKSKALYDKQAILPDEYQKDVDGYKRSRQEYLLIRKKHHRALMLEKVQDASVSDAKITLKKSKLRLAQTTVSAPVDGFVNNLRLYPGDYAKAGETLFGLIDSSSWFITANIQETNLPMVAVGKKVWVYLSSCPWHLYRGKIESISRGVSRSATSEKGALPFVEPVTSWIRYPYRIPVKIRLLDFPVDKTLHRGIDAKVMIP